MNNNKQTCPQCSKLIPVTASNCKYCGAALSVSHGPSLFDSFPSIPPAPPIPPTPPIPGSVPPPPPSVAPKTAPQSSHDDADDWIPEADEPSEMIQLDQLPLAENTEARDEVTNPSIPLPEDVLQPEDKTVVSSMSEVVLDQMSSPAETAESSDGTSDYSSIGDAPGPIVDEGSGFIDLDDLEDPDDEPEASEAAKAIPSITEESVSDIAVLSALDEASDPEIDLGEVEESVVAELPPADVSSHDDKTVAVAAPEAPEALEAPKAAVPSPPPVIGRPSVPSASIPAIPNVGRPSVPGAPSIPPVAPSFPPAAPSVTPVAPSIPPATTSDATPENNGISSDVGPSTPVISSDTASVAAPAATAAEVAVEMSATSAPVAAMQISKESELQAPTAPVSPGEPSVIVDDEFGVVRQTTPPGMLEDELELEGGISTRKIILISVSAFVVTLAVALTYVFMTKTPSKIEVVDSSSLEPKLNLTQPAKPDPIKVDTEPAAPTEVDTGSPEPVPVASNCLPLSRYYKKFPWRNHFETLLESAGKAKICELLGSGPNVVADAFAGKTVVGPTGYDWIVDGNRIEFYPGDKVGARAPSIEFVYTGGKLFKIKVKYRDLKMGRRADADALQKIFKKEDASKDHLGREATVFDEQDMKVTLIEEEWYGRTLRTLEFSSVALNEELAGHIQKLERLEAVYKDAESAYFGWKFDQALAKYEEVNNMAPGIGAALVKRGLIHLRSDDFGNARALAEKALQSSGEDDVKAEAKGILAVNELRNGNRDTAIALLREAAALAPSNDRFSGYISQLADGEYTVQNIAQTAARMACIQDGKSEASEIGVLARGFFPDMKTYQSHLKEVAKEKEFKETKKNLVAWECK